MSRNVLEELETLNINIENLSKSIINSCYTSEGKVSILGLKQAKIQCQILIKRLQAFQKLANYINGLKKYNT